MVGLERTYMHTYLPTHQDRADGRVHNAAAGPARTPRLPRGRTLDERRAKPATSQAFALVLGTQELCAKPARLSRAPVRLHRNSCAASAAPSSLGTEAVARR